ncbi:MAG: GNAT family N-acetyltransferase [Actinobacteria bacterium]|nr:GNAT family N-acetyltransferase [Actinomycetota bacterium]
MPIRPALPQDVPAILSLIRGLAEYERALDQVHATEVDLLESLFCENPQVFAHVAIAQKEVIGIAIWHLNYSTWLGKHGIYLEDLYVKPEHRGAGFGIGLLSELARICLDRGYERLQWWVLDWNTPSIDFYRSLGAVPMDEWTVFRSTGDSIKKIASATSPTNNQ